jgi:hypothetical protein
MRGVTWVLGAVALTVSACVPPPPPPEPAAGIAPPAPDPGPQEREPDTCGAAPLQSLVGQPEAAVAAAGITRRYRVVPWGGIVTQEYDAGRINIFLDAGGRVARVTCG